MRSVTRAKTNRHNKTQMEWAKKTETKPDNEAKKYQMNLRLLLAVFLSKVLSHT